MRLHALGYNNHQEPGGPSASTTTSDRLASTCILEADVIRILWASWCDAVMASRSSTGMWVIQYRGAGITPEQQEHIAQSARIREAVCGRGGTLDFFGSTLHEGLRGYVIKSSHGTNNELCIFSSDVEVGAGAPLSRIYSSAMMQNISTVHMDSSGQVLLGLEISQNKTQVLHFSNPNLFAAYLDAQAESHPSMEQIAPFTPLQWYTNATTSTALGVCGKVFTSSRDLRFSKCLGRPSARGSGLEAIRYFSETCVQAISSGGYMSGAVSTEGELFLWGQSSIPGHDGSILLLEDSTHQRNERSVMVSTEIACAPGQDEWIKCMDVYIGGREACTQKLSIGHGHVLVAAEVDGGGMTKRAVLGAGVNSNGQLGLPRSTKFVEAFEEIAVFRDQKIQQLVATGWSTFVVTA